jgi:hypothetical protein
MLQLLTAAPGPTATSKGKPLMSAHEGRPVVLLSYAHDAVLSMLSHWLINSRTP